LNATAAIEDVITTLLIDGTLAHDLRTLSVPFNAGSINSAWKELYKISLCVEKNLEYTTLNFSISQRRNSLKIGDTTKDFIKLKILQRKLSTFTNTQHSRLKLHIRLSLLNHSRLTLHIGLSLLD
jgi:hypothetical protein